MLRLFEDYKSKEIRIGYKLLSKEWDALNQMVKNTCCDYQLINTKIDSYGSKIQKILLLHEFEGHSITLDELLFKVKDGSSNSKKEYCFIEYTQEVIECLNTSGKAGNALVYSWALNKVKYCTKSETLLFSNSTYKFLKAQCYQKNLSLTKFVGVSGLLIEKHKIALNEIYDRCCLYIDGHSNLEEVVNEPTLDEFRIDFELVK